MERMIEMKSKDYTADNIKYLRTKNNLTYKELAEQINVHHSSINYAEQGKQKLPKVEKGISRYFGIDPEILSVIDLEEETEKERVYRSNHQMGYVIVYSRKEHQDIQKRAVCIQRKLVWILERPSEYKVYEATYCNISSYVKMNPTTQYFQKYED